MWLSAILNVYHLSTSIHKCCDIGIFGWLANTKTVNLVDRVQLLRVAGAAGLEIVSSSTCTEHSNKNCDTGKGERVLQACPERFPLAFCEQCVDQKILSLMYNWFSGTVPQCLQELISCL